ncbi:MAG: hypothetical protein NXI01_05540 [Gammaproteobacteria bacterium]|nr:hypothetical protein [Gammaproteobacteria bacterium]
MISTNTPVKCCHCIFIVLVDGLGYALVVVGRSVKFYLEIIVKKILLSLLVVFSFIMPTFALSVNDLPDSYTIKVGANAKKYERTIAGDQHIGFLQLAPNKKGTFYYFDDQNQLNNTIILTPKSSRFTSVRRFDILDQYQHVIAYADMSYCSLGSFEGLKLLAEDETTLVTIRQGMRANYLGVYVKDKLVAEITRHWFDGNNDVKLIDKSKLLAAGIDMNLLNAMFAFNQIPVSVLGKEMLKVDA